MIIYRTKEHLRIREMGQKFHLIYVHVAIRFQNYQRVKNYLFHCKVGEPEKEKVSQIYDQYVTEVPAREDTNFLGYRIEEVRWSFIALTTLITGSKLSAGQAMSEPVKQLDTMTWGQHLPSPHLGGGRTLYKKQVPNKNFAVNNPVGDKFMSVFSFGGIAPRTPSQQLHAWSEPVAICRANECTNFLANDIQLWMMMHYYNGICDFLSYNMSTHIGWFLPPLWSRICQIPYSQCARPWIVGVWDPIRLE